MREMNLSLEQSLHFNQGQKLTPDQLNALSDFARNRDALLTKLLFGTQGIVVGYENELSVQVAKSDLMAVQVMPGAAINAQGETLILTEPTLVSLHKVASATEPVTYILQLVPEEILESPFVDPEIPELKGYRFRRWMTRLKISRELEARGAEVARVTLDPSVKALRQISSAEANTDAPVELGTIDPRVAPRFSVYSRSHLTFAEHQFIRRSARDFRAMLIRLKELFPRTQAMPVALDRAFMLEAEVSDTFFQPSKVGFLLVELKKTVFELIDELRDLTKEAKAFADEVWGHLFGRTEHLTPARGPVGRAEFAVLAEITFVILEKVLKTATEKDRQVMIRESLVDIRGYDFGMHLQHSFGGVLFRLKDSVKDQELLERVRAETEFSTMKNLSATFLNDTTFSGRGAFYSDGKLHLKIGGLRAGADTIILLRLYKRRGIKEFSLVLNGHTLTQERLAPNDAVDKILHTGALANGTIITAGENLLTVDIHRVDLDFGLFGIYVYQEQTT